MIRVLLTCVFILLYTGSVNASEPRTGPVIKDFGPVFAVPPGFINLEQNKHYKVSMDVFETGENIGDLNRRLESAARFLNMHAMNGIDPADIEFAIVVHGSAGKDLLKDTAYTSRFDQLNPNTALLNALGEAGVKIYICGQTASFRGLASEEFNPVVTMALSAMTVHVLLQSQGYTLIPF